MLKIPFIKRMPMVLKKARLKSMSIIFVISR
jgi:hypothetical protein